MFCFVLSSFLFRVYSLWAIFYKGDSTPASYFVLLLAQSLPRFDVSTYLRLYRALLYHRALRRRLSRSLLHRSFILRYLSLHLLGIQPSLDILFRRCQHRKLAWILWQQLTEWFAHRRISSARIKEFHSTYYLVLFFIFIISPYVVLYANFIIFFFLIY